jgi:hypothetical protein
MPLKSMEPGLMALRTRTKDPIQHGESYFSEFIHNLTGAILWVVDDVPVDSETSMMTLSISRICWFSLSKLFIAVRLRVYIHRVSMCIDVRVCIYTLFSKKLVHTRFVIASPAKKLHLGSDIVC